jgi:putative heme-binding domain-containing protein
MNHSRHALPLRAYALILATSFVGLSSLASFAQAADAPLPQWIWRTNKPAGNEVVYFRKAFEAGAVKRAVLRASCDNSLIAFLNGQEVGRSDEWQTPFRKDVTKQLVAGENVLAVRGKNAGGIAALIVDLELTDAKDKVSHVVSDDTWLASATESPNWMAVSFAPQGWQKPHVFGKLGMGPWGNVLGGEGLLASATPGESLETLPGFKAELLYSVPKPDQGSWVSMTFDNRGRIIASDQSASLYRITLPGEDAPIKVEQLAIPIGQAHGLLYALDSLYVTVNGNAAQGSGLYRLRDTNGDDQYDEIKLLKKIQGGGEHGPHGVVLGPDNQLYMVAGNFTKPPEPLSPKSPHRNWGEDLLLPRQPDGRGHDPNIMAPGGWVARTDPDGREWEFFCAGLRNAYDLAFHPDGELFTYDSDMEWDVGAPWYRPTRVNHCVSGAEFGWRNGSGKWPAYYPDSLGGFDIGLGSPTGVVFGTGAKFPAKYQRALFALDWTYGRIYAMHLTPKGAGYTATFEQFVAGKPLPVTDVAIGPDGAMYFTIGGRGTQSGLYRLSYVGPESTSPVGPVVDEKAAQARALRRKLEAFHGRSDPQAIPFAWPYLESQDRNLRYAARIAIERQDPKLWQDKALGEKRSTAAIHALVALARVGSTEVHPQLLAALLKIDYPRLTEDQQLAYLRAVGLAFIRGGKPDSVMAGAFIAKLDPHYPAASETVNRELSQVLVYLEDPAVVGKSMALLNSAPTQEEQMHYIFVLRVARVGWTPDLRKAYFSWLNLAETNYPGGASFKPFLDHIRKEAIETLSDQEKTALKSVIEGQQRVPVVRNEKPRKFVHNWQMEDLLPILDQASHGRSFETGKAAFAATQCTRCHRFKSDGGSVGHDLTGAGNRFSTRDLLESILLPSKVISDQYASKTVVTTEGRTLTGLVSEMPDGSVSVFQSNGETTVIAKTQIEEIVASSVSTMPEGLVSVLTKDEILDLLAYLRAAGDPQDKAFKK